jgi:hypothetical protein
VNKRVIWMIGAIEVIGAGCGVTADLSTVVQAVCPPSACGVNGPGIDARGFHSISKSGQVNEAGYKLVRFEKDGVQYKLDVTHGYLTGSRGAVVALSGQALVGARLVLADKDGESRSIRIAQVGQMTFPVGEPDPIETYVFEYPTIATGGWRNLCAQRDLSAVVDPGLDAMGMQPEDSILFEGDRIDLDSKTVAVDPDLDWFNIGCAGHVLSKLHLTRNTIASTSAVPGALSFSGRQATLKLVTADYCGDGTAFTVTGQRLVWQGGQVEYNEPPTTIEAHWGEHGALCLDTPRMAVPTTDEGAIAFPNIWAAITAHCRPPSCQEYDPTGEQRVSGNPGGNDY